MYNTPTFNNNYRNNELAEVRTAYLKELSMLRRKYLIKFMTVATQSAAK